MSTESAPRFRIGNVPPLARGFTERPDTAHGIIEAFVPGSAVALVPDLTSAEGSSDWLGTCGKTQIAVMTAESLWRSRAIDMLIWIAATSRAAVLSAFVEASVTATGIEPAGTAESVVMRFLSRLDDAVQPWLVVLDDLPENANLDGLWPAGPAGRLLVTSRQPAIAVGRPETQVIPVGFFSVREALKCLTERLSAHPVRRLGAIDLVETLGREPLALAQASSVVASSALDCLGYRDLFVRRRQQTWVATGEMPSAAMLTWTLSVVRAESLLPGMPVRPVLVLVALLDGHGIPGAIFGTSAVAAYLGGPATRFSAAADPKSAWDILLAVERVGLISVDRSVTPPTVLMSSTVQAAIRVAAPAEVQESAARAAANALLEAWPADEPELWTADFLRANAASLHDSAADVLWADGCHPLLLRVGQSLDEGRLAGPALEYWRDLATRCDTKLAPGHADALVVAARLAAAYLTGGHAAQALLWYQRVLAERSRDLTPGHPTIAAARIGLARAFIMAGEPAEAVAVLLQAISDGEQFHGTGHPDTLSARDELAAAYRAAGDLVAAGRLLARSLKDRERLQGPRDLQTMATRDRLAAACLAEGRVKDAVSHYKRVLADREKVLGRRHPDTIAAGASLSAAYHAAGRMPAALQVSERCCADSERVLGPDHPDTLARLADLARLYREVGRIGDAEVLRRRTAPFLDLSRFMMIAAPASNSYRCRRSVVVAAVLALGAGSATRYRCWVLIGDREGVVRDRLCLSASLSFICRGSRAVEA
jgi:tetratricopeptide (TPR) repeat protein